SRRAEQARSPSAPGARRASRAVCCAGCAISPWWRAMGGGMRAPPIRPSAVSRGIGVGSTSWIGVSWGASLGIMPAGAAGGGRLAGAWAEQRDVIEEVIEPYLIQEGLLQRTPRGRMLTAAGYRYLGLPEPAHAVQFDLLGATAGEAEDA